MFDSLNVVNMKLYCIDEFRGYVICFEAVLIAKNIFSTQPEQLSQRFCQVSRLLRFHTKISELNQDNQKKT